MLFELAQCWVAVQGKGTWRLLEMQEQVLAYLYALIPGSMRAFSKLENFTLVVNDFAIGMLTKALSGLRAAELRSSRRVSLVSV